MQVKEISAPSVQAICGASRRVGVASPSSTALLLDSQNLPMSKRRAKQRVAAYCRVSTNRVDQETSFEAQQAHFSNLISQNPAWELVNIYADEESGIRTDRRDSFMRMIADCEAGRVDMVLTKSISRFARNTLDCLEYIRRLKAMGIPILFTKEGINSMDSGGEVLITVLASIAQQESASISQNVQMGIRYRFAEGKVCAGVHRLLGYERTRKGGLRIVPKEAAIVQRIFRDYLDGYSTKHIARMLRAEAVNGTKVTPSGVRIKRNWNYRGIEYILKNEKYTGDLILQKYYTVDYLTKKTARNTGQLPQYYVENSHEPIVPRDVYQQVQAEMARRKEHWTDFRYNHSIAFAGKTVCGCCGMPYRRAGGKDIWWRCETRMRKSCHVGVTCDSGPVRETSLEDAVVKGLTMLPARREELVRLEERLLWRGVNRADEVLAELDSKIGELESLSAKNGEELACNERYAALCSRWAETVEQKAVYADKLLHVRNLMDRVRVMLGTEEARDGQTRPGDPCHSRRDFFQATEPRYHFGVYSADDVFRFVEKIIVGERTFTVVFKAGVSVNVER